VLRPTWGTSFSISLSRGGGRVGTRLRNPPALVPPRPDSAPPRGDSWSRDGQSSVMTTGPRVTFRQLLIGCLFQSEPNRLGKSSRGVHLRAASNVIFLNNEFMWPFCLIWITSPADSTVVRGFFPQPEDPPAPFRPSPTSQTRCRPPEACAIMSQGAMPSMIHFLSERRKAQADKTRKRII
jgi:hypothetical protein